MQEISQLIQKVVLDLFNEQVEVELTRTEEQFGDYASNVALRLSKKLGQNPREIATQIADKLINKKIEKAVVAGPGFINITLNNEFLWNMTMQPAAMPLKGQQIVTEYSDPNPFKVLHAGHLYTSIVGDSISNLLESAGAMVHRVNFGGDVGRHVAITMWAILKELGGEHPEKLSLIPEASRSEWMAKCYVAGTNAYEDDEQAKEAIITLNKRVYQLHQDNDQSSPFAQIYWTTRDWSYRYFNAFYERIGSGFERYYPESQTAPLGLAKAQELLGEGVLNESDGATVFEGEKYGLHTRVFITKTGLPTYETKDLGLTLSKKRDYDPDRSIIITGNDITEYMKVVLKVVEQFAPELAEHTTHITHGNVKLAGGVKMSSRKGNFLRAVDVLDEASQANQAENGQTDERISLGAIKYSFLKSRIGGDIIFDPKESVNLHGNSGPYLQYAYARARSILEKSSVAPAELKDLDSAERSLLRKVSEFNEVVARATSELMPHYICTYLYELAQIFNRFYEKSRVIDDPREAVRIQLVSDYAQTLKNGLTLLGIHAPEKM
jgi:arginyl-tRNA synthetase